MVSFKHVFAAATLTGSLLLSAGYCQDFGISSRIQVNQEMIKQKTDQPFHLIKATNAEPVPYYDPAETISPRFSHLIDQDKDQEKQESKPRKREEFGPWPRKGIRAISLDIRDSAEIKPEDRSGHLVNGPSQPWEQFSPTQKVFAWVAPDISYQPLYFEDVALERYGQSAAPYRQGLRSGVHFFRAVTLMPYHMLKDAPHSCDYPLGFCRPGNNVDYTIQRQWFGG